MLRASGAFFLCTGSPFQSRFPLRMGGCRPWTAGQDGLHMS